MIQVRNIKSCVIAWYCRIDLVIWELLATFWVIVCVYLYIYIYTLIYNIRAFGLIHRTRNDFGLWRVNYFPFQLYFKFLCSLTYFILCFRFWKVIYKQFSQFKYLPVRDRLNLTHQQTSHVWYECVIFQAGSPFVVRVHFQGHENYTWHIHG